MACWKPRCFVHCIRVHAGPHQGVLLGPAVVAAVVAAVVVPAPVVVVVAAHARHQIQRGYQPAVEQGSLDCRCLVGLFPARLPQAHRQHNRCCFAGLGLQPRAGSGQALPLQHAPCPPKKKNKQATKTQAKRSKPSKEKTKAINRLGMRASKMACPSHLRFYFPKQERA